MEQPKKHFVREYWPTILLAFALLLVVSGITYSLASPGLTPREIALFQVISAMMSFGASYLVTKAYAEKTSDQTLRDHGVQIASGIMVLRRQIDALTDWVGHKRDKFAGNSAEPVLEHVEETLQGFREMTHAALGGIAQVIGDALNQYDAVMGQISTIRAEAQEQTNQIQQKIETAVSNDEISRLAEQIREIAIQTERRIAETARQSALPIPEPVKRRFSAECPHCRTDNSCEMIDSRGETKVITCSNKECQRRFNVHVSAAHTVFARPNLDQYGVAALGSGAATLTTGAAEEAAKRVLIARAMPDPFAAAKYFLSVTQSWVAPTQLPKLLQTIVDHGEQLRGTGEDRTPINLQARILGDQLCEVPRTDVRTFLKMAKAGGAFEFAPGLPSTFYAAYVNDVTSDRLVRAFTRSVIRRIWQIRPWEVGEAAGLAKLVLGPAFPGGESVFRQAIEEYRSRTVTAEPRVS